MPRRRRATRPVRRPQFQPAPEASEETPEDAPEAPEEIDEQFDEAPPQFADEPAVAMPVGFGASGPVETRSYRTAREQRAEGRRLAQLRRSTSEERVSSTRAATGQLPVFDRTFIAGELRRILITSVAMTILVVVLALALR